MEDEVGHPMTGNAKVLEPHQLLDMYRQMVMFGDLINGPWTSYTRNIPRASIPISGRKQ